MAQEKQAGPHVDWLHSVLADWLNPRPFTAGQICAAAKVSAQATCALLELVAEFDASNALRYWVDVKSVAHWLSWNCSMAPGAAREHVRVARALPKMPTVLAEFREGRLSYSKVREISRVVDVIDEARLVDLARTATAAQLATMIAAFRSCETNRLTQGESRSVSWHEREDGMVDLRARLTKEDAAVLRAAVQAAKDQFGTPPSAVQTGLDFGADPASADPARADPARADPEVGTYTMTDALVDVGRGFLNAAPEDRSGEDRSMVVVHVSAELLAENVSAGSSSAESVPAGTPEANVCHIAGQGPIEPDTARRLACDNPLLPAILVDGEPLALGRTRRLVSRAQRRALMIRDGMCRFPGCAQTRHLKAHHVVSWANGGPTDLHNLILVCQFHHTAVHEGGVTIDRNDGRWEFRSPAGALIAGWGASDQFLPRRLARERREATAMIAAVDSLNHPKAQPIRPRWAGESFSVQDCVQALVAMKLAA